jgi:branched-chain amino acid transport system substrate-binding protein
MKALNYKPEEVIQNSVSATDTIMKLALSKGLASTLDGAISTSYLMDPQDPKYANNAAMKLYKAQMAKFAPTQDPNNGLFFYGFAKAWDVAKVLGLSGKTPSRSKLMYAARHMNWVNPFAIPGVKEKTTPSDPYPLSQLKLIKFNSSTARWTEFGSLITGRGGTK